VEEEEKRNRTAMDRKKRETSREMELNGKIEQPLSSHVNSHAAPPAPLNVRKLSNVRNVDGPIYISSPSAAAGSLYVFTMPFSLKAFKLNVVQFE
jgi:hypothetical protein